MAEPTERLVLTTPRFSLAVALAACVGCLALGVWFINANDDPTLGVWSWIGAIFLVGGIIMGVIGLRRPPQLILTPQDFTLTGAISVGPIPWSEVESFFVYSEPSDADGHGGVLPHASWKLKPGSLHAQGLVARLNRAGDMGMDGSLPRNIGMEPEALTQLMEGWRVRYG